MKAKFKLEKRIDSRILFKKLKAISNLDSNNKVSFDAFEYEILEWTFLSLIEFGGLYSIESKKQILSSTFTQLLLLDKFDHNFFYEVLNNQITQHNKKQETEFYLLTSLSLKELPFRRVNIGNSQISITGKQFPKKFRIHRVNITKLNNENVEDNDYLKIVVKVKARDSKDGYEKAYHSLEVFRSILCLLFNPKFTIHIGLKSNDPINNVRLGKFSSFHLVDGTCANEGYWYESNFRRAKLFDFKSENRNIIKVNIKRFVKKYNLCLDKHKYALAKALNIYVSAFDESNTYICFLRAWTALETILNTDQNEVVIKRCITMYHPDIKPYEKQVLEALRNYRNEFVHEGGSRLDPLVACFKIQEFIFNLIFKFNFIYAGFFNTIEESTLFLDNYSPGLYELKTRKKIIDRAIELKERNTK